MYWSIENGSLVITLCSSTDQGDLIEDTIRIPLVTLTQHIAHQSCRAEIEAAAGEMKEAKND